MRSGNVWFGLPLFCILILTDRVWGEVEFNRDIRPILSRNCFQCHGPDAYHREAGLRLDDLEGVRAAFVPGDLEQSEGWQRITSSDIDLRMPPSESHEPLKTIEIEYIRQWIVAGAEWQGHWSFNSPRKPEVPNISKSGYVRNPIDAFVQARLEVEGLEPNEEAEREHLLRRVTFDLTGLPPTISEIDAFLADDEPGAYERVVDRLLASEHFGERMALGWMDVARYGDTSVFHADGTREMWAWRDWVIRSYNGDMPFDQFLSEQLAGDLMEDPTWEQRVATGFLRNNATTDEGGVIPEEFRVEYAVDRVKTTSVAFLGLTLECGQCHDHKYDPISQTDYYRYYAYFNQAADPGMQTRSGNQAPMVDVFDRHAIRAIRPDVQQLEDLRRQIRQRAELPDSRFDTWHQGDVLKSIHQPSPPEDTLLHLPLDHEVTGTNVTFLYGERQWDALIRGEATPAEGFLGKALKFSDKSAVDLSVVGDWERTDAFSFGMWVKPLGKGNGTLVSRVDEKRGHRGFDFALADGRLAFRLIHQVPGNMLKLSTLESIDSDRWQHVLVTYDGSSRSEGVTIFVNGLAQATQVERARLTDTIRTEQGLQLGKGVEGGTFVGTLDEVRFYNRTLSGAEVDRLVRQDDMRAILRRPQDDWSNEERLRLKGYFLRTHDDCFRNWQDRITVLEKRIADAHRPISTVMAMEDVDPPRQTYVLLRGSYDAPDEDQPVNPGVLEFLAPLPQGAPANRLGLARWMTRSDHPLTSRVAVNRYWLYLFGQGLVRTVEDFGAQGEWPSHPDLLDWLAVEMMERGWSRKQIVRLIVTSHTYRQSSRMSSELRERDPENYLLARGPRFRMLGEFIRDNALAASGLMIYHTGGPSVKPYQPPGLWSEVSIDANLRFIADTGEKLYRRSMYTYWKRSATAPNLTIFDAPTRETCVMRRSRTNTPLQALVTLNDPQFTEASRNLAQRVIVSRPERTDEQIQLAHRLATGAYPDSTALETLREAYQEELEVFQLNRDRARQLLTIGESYRPSWLDEAELAAMTVVCSIIFNLDETLVRN